MTGQLGLLLGAVACLFLVASIAVWLDIEADEIRRRSEGRRRVNKQIRTRVAAVSGGTVIVGGGMWYLTGYPWMPLWVLDCALISEFVVGPAARSALSHIQGRRK